LRKRIDSTDTRRGADLMDQLPSAVDRRPSYCTFYSCHESLVGVRCVKRTNWYNKCIQERFNVTEGNRRNEISAIIAALLDLYRFAFKRTTQPTAGYPGRQRGAPPASGVPGRTGSTSRRAIAEHSVRTQRQRTYTREGELVLLVFLRDCANHDQGLV
jgi:hypothetical protein